MSCDQCGEEAKEFREGVCAPCWEENQGKLDLHNAEYARWQHMSDGERMDAIKQAVER